MDGGSNALPVGNASGHVHKALTVLQQQQAEVETLLGTLAERQREIRRQQIDLILAEGPRRAPQTSATPFRQPVAATAGAPQHEADLALQEAIQAILRRGEACLGGAGIQAGQNTYGGAMLGKSLDAEQLLRRNPQGEAETEARPICTVMHAQQDAIDALRILRHAQALTLQRPSELANGQLQRGKTIEQTPLVAALQRQLVHQCSSGEGSAMDPNLRHALEKLLKNDEAAAGTSAFSALVPPGNLVPEVGPRIAATRPHGHGRGADGLPCPLSSILWATQGGSDRQDVGGAKGAADLPRDWADPAAAATLAAHGVTSLSDQLGSRSVSSLSSLSTVGPMSWPPCVAADAPLVPGLSAFKAADGRLVPGLPWLHVAEAVASCARGSGNLSRVDANLWGGGGGSWEQASTGEAPPRIPGDGTSRLERAPGSSNDRGKDLMADAKALSSTPSLASVFTSFSSVDAGKCVYVCV